MISPTKVRFVDDLNQLTQLSYSDIERYNAANAAHPDLLIPPGFPMQVFSVREDGVYINGERDEELSAFDVPDGSYLPDQGWAVRESPDQPFRFREPEPPYQPLPGQGKHEGMYVSPHCELNGNPVELAPNWHKWPAGMRRKRELHVFIEEIIYIVAAWTIALTAWPKPGNQGFGYIAIAFLFFIIPWLEWSARCENRKLVLGVGVALNVAILAWNHNLKENQRAAAVERQRVAEQVQRAKENGKWDFS